MEITGEMWSVEVGGGSAILNGMELSRSHVAILAYLCFQYLLKQFTDDYLSNHMHGEEVRKVFIQHP